MHPAARLFCSMLDLRKERTVAELQQSNRRINYDNNQPRAEERTQPKRFHRTGELCFQTKPLHDVQRGNFEVQRQYFNEPGRHLHKMADQELKWLSKKKKVFLKLLTWARGWEIYDTHIRTHEHTQTVRQTTVQLHT